MDKITASKIKKTNRNNIYNTIYQLKQVSKQQLADSLGLSLPTITHNLKELEELQLIQKEGVFPSTTTAGRKAQIISCNNTARIAIGVEILVDQIHIVAVDLYGHVINRDTLKLTFESSQLYHCALGNWINNFISELMFSKEAILGVGISVQGLVSPDRQTIIYGEILHCTGMTLSELAEYIKYPCLFIHDTEAAAFTEIWNCEQIPDTLYLLINMTLGGALIISGKIYGEPECFSGIIEHMTLIPDGKPCYCGQKGCADSYCSLNALLADSNVSDLHEFFSLLREKNPECIAVWHSYLQYLALAINNAIHIVDCDVVLSGLISLFLEEDDILLLNQYLQSHNSFSFYKPRIRVGASSEDIAAIGAAYYLLTNFFEHDLIFQ